MSEQATIFKAKQSLNNQTNKHYMEILDEDALLAKQTIRSSINNLIFKLQLREKWLLNHVDEIHQYFTNIIRADSEKMFKVCGKMQSLIDISSLCQAQNPEAWNLYISTCLQDLENFEKQAEHYEKGSILFTGDDKKLKELIAQFGKLSNSTINSFFDDSEKFSEFTESDTLSSVSETHTVDDCSKYACGSNYMNPAYEIEDMDKQLDNLKLNQSAAISNFCRANEVCCSVTECLFDEPCHVTAVEEQQTSPYVLQIEQAMRCVSQGQVDKNCSLIRDDPAFPSNPPAFDDIVLNLTNEFERIIENNVCSAHSRDVSSLDNESKSPPLVESLSLELDNIINSQSRSDVIQYDLPVTDTCPVFSRLASDISNILSFSSSPHQAPSYAVSVTPEMLKLKDFSAYQQLVDERAELSKQQFSFGQFENKEKRDFEKAEVDEDFYMVKKEGCCSISDVSDVLMSIIDS